MDLLFKTSEEIKNYLPYIDADITFENIVLDAEQATAKVVKLIGKGLYEKILSIYSDGYDDDEERLIKAVAYPIAVDAYRVYVVNNDVAHTNNGRRMRLNEHEKQAFEWQIDRDNKNLEKRYYRALDRMIEILDEINPLIKEEDNKSIHWKDSEEYKATFTPLFRTTDDFNEYFEIESRYLLIKLIPGVKKCINEEIIPRVTASKWETYIHALDNPEDDNLIYHIKAACAYYALAWASTRLSATILPEGVLQQVYGERNTTQGKSVPTTNQFGVLKKSFLDDFKSSIQKVESLLQPKKEVDSNQSIDYGHDQNACDKILDM